MYPKKKTDERKPKYEETIISFEDKYSRFYIKSMMYKY